MYAKKSNLDMKLLLITLSILLMPSVCRAELLFLECLVTGSHTSSTDKSRLPPTKVTVEINVFNSHKSINIQAPSNYAMTISTRKQGGFSSDDFSINEKFFLVSTTTVEPLITTRIQINRLSGQISAERTYLGNTLISTNLDGKCEKLKARIF
jgi:hypothetical protein